MVSDFLTFYVEYQNPMDSKFVAAPSYAAAASAAQLAKTARSGNVEKIWYVGVNGKLMEIDSKTASTFQ